MAYREDMVKERVGYLSQDPARLRDDRGQGLYEKLQSLGISYNQYFRALGTNVDDYCAQEFGVDVNRITVDRFFQSDPTAK